MLRRSFLTGLTSLFAAPVAARAAVPDHNLRTVVTFKVDLRQAVTIRAKSPSVFWRKMYQGVPIQEVDGLLLDTTGPIADAVRITPPSDVSHGCA